MTPFVKIHNSQKYMDLRDILLTVLQRVSIKDHRTLTREGLELPGLTKDRLELIRFHVDNQASQRDPNEHI